MNDSKLTIRGELTLILVVIINSLGVVLMLHSGSGISAISSVPYAFSEVFPKLTLGTWTYIFQSLLILTLMVLRKKFIPEYLLALCYRIFLWKNGRYPSGMGQPASIHDSIACIILCFKLSHHLLWNRTFKPL